MKNKSVLYFGILILAIVALLWWGRSVSTVTSSAFWPGTDVACLTFGHQNLAQHIHPVLAITVDGTPESIPANIGVTQSCMAEAHTHDGTGTLHLESISSEREFVLDDIFTVWGRPIAREGFTHRVTINGEEVTDTSSHILHDGDEVIVAYTSVGSSDIPEVSVPKTVDEGDTNVPFEVVN